MKPFIVTVRQHVEDVAEIKVEARSASEAERIVRSMDHSTFPWVAGDCERPNEYDAEEAE